MNKITDLVKKLEAVQADLAAYEKLAGKAHLDLTNTVTAGTTVAAAKSVILDARLTLDLVAAKKHAAGPKRSALAQELKRVLYVVVNGWNASVQAKREKLEEDIVTMNLALFNNDRDAARRWWNQGHLIQMPIFAKFRDAIYDTQALRNAPNWKEIEQAEHVLRHLERYADSVGLKPEQFV
jgi:hypothetical protein